MNEYALRAVNDSLRAETLAVCERLKAKCGECARLLADNERLQAETERLTTECGNLRDEFGYVCMSASTLCTEVERLQGEIKRLQDDTIAKLKSALHEVGEINKRLREALAFYATIDLYANTFGDSMAKLLSDNGYTAQRALEGKEGI